MPQLKMLKRHKRHRRYANLGISAADLISRMNKAKANYVVLRWFDELPKVKKGEDIDILIADEDVSKAEIYLQGNRLTGLPCDLYSVSGLKGTDWRGMAYYPPALAKIILAESRDHTSGARIPSDCHYFFSLCYHCLFHKGYSSGLPSRLGLNNALLAPEHDYLETLKKSAQAAKIHITSFFMEDLFIFLKGKGWTPPRDTLDRLARKNMWVRDFLAANCPERVILCPYICTIVIREAGLAKLDRIRAMLWQEGLEILVDTEIPKERRLISAQYIRGGNWHQGPWPVSGGNPAHIIVTCDELAAIHNVEPSKYASTQDIQKVKVLIRKELNKDVRKDRRCNSLHSADNAEQAEEYLRTALGYSEAALREVTRKANELIASTSNLDFLAELSRHKRRSGLWLIRHPDGLAVFKLYRHGRERFLIREIEARSVAQNLSNVIPIIEAGANYFIMPFIEASRKNMLFFTPKQIREIKNIIRHFRGAGYELIDFKPGNLLIDKHGDVKCFDFEHMQQVAPTTDLKGCYCWYRIPDPDKFDIPSSRNSSKRLNYYRHWFKHMGIPLFVAVSELPDILVVAFQVFLYLPILLVNFLSKLPLIQKNTRNT
jgi:hypothetical protein